MESHSSSGQILIECSLGLFVLVMIVLSLIEFNGQGRKKTSAKHKKIEAAQILDFSKYRN